ncbi:NlpC/P60 family protein [uncultured Pseudomonas sp.]|uniref:C40 family peptidase n=1 Tax=uncultured Pseudomonas sp. TaxID=114707 RepID=UPI0025E62E81|nr:NlpC/P60 family protein [uncultured Pseudomonas sp.]
MPRNRLAPLVPLTLVCLLAACASAPQSSDAVVDQARSTSAQPLQTAALHGTLGTSTGLEPAAAEAEGAQPRPPFPHSQSPRQLDWDREVGPRQALPNLADQILNRATQLVGTPYRKGGSTLAGFDCSGFVNYVFRERAGMKLPRSTREIIDLQVPVVSKNDLEPGDLLLFNSNGRGRVSHTGIYMGEGKFIHSSSRRSGGVRVDSLDDQYWKVSFLEGKRVLR